MIREASDENGASSGMFSVFLKRMGGNDFGSAPSSGANWSSSSRAWDRLLEESGAVVSV